MRTLVTGAGGMLAHTLVPTLQGRGHEVAALDRSALDVTDAAAVDAALEAFRPEVVIQCAAYTAVDAAEADEAAAFRVNADATDLVARACQRIGARFVYLSTDYVFPGTATRPYRPEDPTDPVNAYGRSKLAGERAALRGEGALVVRTSWLYGEGGPNFVDSMTRLARTRPSLQVVNDQVGRPTWTGSLSRAIAGLVEAGASGVYHVTDAGPPVTWFHFAEKVLSLQDLFVPIEPLTTRSLGRPAARPAYSVLDCSGTEAVLQCSLPLWPDMLGEYLRQRTG